MGILPSVTRPSSAFLVWAWERGYTPTKSVQLLLVFTQPTCVFERLHVNIIIHIIISEMRYVSGNHMAVAHLFSWLLPRAQQGVE